MLKKLALSALTALSFSTLAQAQNIDGFTGEASLNGSATTAEGNTNKKRYNLGYQIDRDLNDRLYVFANADYFSDDFGAFKQGYFLGTGLGYQVIVDGPTTWRLEAGAGYRSQKSRLVLNNPLGVPSIRENELAGRLFSDFDHAFNESVSVYNDTELLYSASDTFITNETGVTSQLWENLALRASFRVENHSNVPVGREKTDTISRIGVVYTMN